METKGKEYVELMFENGDVYKGQIDGGKFNGLGLYFKKDKFVYAGEFLDGNFHGLGRYCEQAQLMLFQGEYQFGQKNGQGRLETYVNSLSYNSLVPDSGEIDHKSYKSYIKDKIIAEVKKDIEGEVMQTIKKVSQEYSGMSEDYIKEQIKEFQPSEFELDTLLKEKTRSTFEKRYIGEFKHDFKNGFGIMKYANSDVYFGSFNNDKRHGFGKYLYLSPKHNCRGYLGYFSEDAMSGLAKLVFKNGDVYHGEFKNNKMYDENALITYSNNDTYKGGVAQNMKHSKGAEYTYANGDKYVGDFRGDKKQGQGSIALYSGNIIYTGEFENDIKKGQAEVEIK